MTRSVNKLTWAALALAFTATVVYGFSLLGPLKGWQVDALGYDRPNDIGGPMLLNEAYRWNVPDVVYALDQSFIAYFGKEGIEAIEEAFAILNDLPPASKITDDGSRLYVGRGVQVPLDTKRINYSARDHQILDLKSHALELILDQMGLAQPERWVFALRGRNTITIGGVTVTNYSVINLNYDPITLAPTHRVNEQLYTYRIRDPIPPDDHADAVESPVNPLAPLIYTSVANGFLGSGQFYTGLTHDDVGAIRFLLNPNHFAIDEPLPDVVRGLGRSAFSSPWIPFNTLSNTPGGGTNLPGGGTNIGTGVGTNLFGIVSTAVRPGLDKLNFKRGSFDSLIGVNFIAVTNQWDDRYVSNGVPQVQNLMRPVTVPDILFTAEDLGLAANLIPVLTARTPTDNWINNDAINGIAGQGGPGVIAPTINIRFTDQLPFFENSSPFLSETNASTSGVWGSFDVTTNEPIVYPKFLDLTLEDLRRLSSGRN